MARMIKKKSSHNNDWTRYSECDPLFDLLRSYYTLTGEIHSSRWGDMCKADMEHQKSIRKKRINDKRNYGE